MSKIETAPPEGTFVELVLSGRALIQDIDDYVAAWHDAPEGSSAAQQELHDFLGLTWDEYRLWVEKPESLRFTLMSRRRGAPVSEVLSPTSKKLRAAARSTNSKDAQDVYDWLVERGRIKARPEEG